MIERLFEQQIILSTAGLASGLNVQIKALFERFGVHLKRGPVESRLGSVLAVIAGMGVAPLPESAVLSCRYGVKCMPLATGDAYVDTYMIRNPVQDEAGRLCQNGSKTLSVLTVGRIGIPIFCNA